MDFDVDRLARLVDERATSPAALDRLGAAVSVVEDLRTHGDQLLDRFVAQARRDGCSWTEIGETLGISKQAAHQRFVAAEQRPAVWPAHATDAVRAALVTAQHESQQMGHNHLGTEHLLLGLLRETDGVAAHALAALGVDRAGVMARIEERIGTGPDRPRDELCVAPRLKRALELARSHARSLGHRCMNTEHVLLGLVDVDDSLAAEILGDLGATPDTVREQLAGMLGVEPEQLRPRSHRRRLRRAAVG